MIEFMKKPMPKKVKRKARLSDHDKEAIDSLRVGEIFANATRKKALCAIMRLKRSGKDGTMQTNDDGTVDVWRSE